VCVVFNRALDTLLMHHVSLGVIWIVAKRQSELERRPFSPENVITEFARTKLPVELFRPEKHINTQTDDKQTAIGQIDQDLHDFHIVTLLGSALADAAQAHDWGYGGNPTFELATRKGICAHDRPLADRDLADIAFIDLCSNAKKRSIRQHDQGLWR
jgi:hypothetical protein